MNKTTITIIFIILATNLFGQKNEGLFTEITIDDLINRRYEIDTAADAIILAESGVTKFIVHEDAIKSQHNRKVRKQILTKAGKDNGNISVAFYRSKDLRDHFNSFEATVYSLEDGKIVKTTIDIKDLIDEQSNDYWARKKYAFPNLKEGSIIEYEYEVLSKRILNLDPWYFQHDIPTLKSKFELSVCPYVNYVVLKSGYHNFENDTVIINPYGFTFDYKSYTTKDYSWSVRDVPAFKDVPFISTAEDYLMKVEFQIESHRSLYGPKYSVMKTWPEFIKEHIENTSEKSIFLNAKTREIKNIVRSVVLENATASEKVKAIYQYIQQNYLWNGYRSKYTHQTMREFLETKTGNVAEINLFLLACIRAADIESYPIMLSTRGNGMIYTEYPINSKFDYVAVVVSDEMGSYLLDATDAETPIGHLPFRCGNGFALRLKKPESDNDVMFFNLDNQKSDNAKIQSIVQLDLDSEMLNITVKEQYVGYKAMQYRDKLKEDGEESFFKWHFSEKELTYKQSKVKNLNDNEEILSTATVLSAPLNMLEDRILVDFMPYNPYNENPFKKKERNYPVDFGKKLDQSFTSTIQIPLGYEVEYMPESTIYMNEDKTLIFNFMSVNNGPFIQIRSVISRKNSTYKVTDYTHLKQFYDEIIKKHKEKIVLKKIKQ